MHFFSQNNSQAQCFFYFSVIASEKSHQNLSDFNLFLFEKIFEVYKKQMFSSVKKRNSGNCIYDYAQSFFGKDFHPKPTIGVVDFLKSNRNNSYQIYVFIIELQ